MISPLRAKAREVARDLALIFIAAALGAFFAAGAPVGLAILPVLGKAGLVAVAGQILLWVTPLTKRYGAFQPKNTLLEEHLRKVPV